MAIIRYFKGDVFHTPTDGKLEYIEDALIQVDDAGIITKVTAKQIKGMRQSWQKHQRIFRLYLKASAFYQGLSICMSTHHNGRKQGSR